MNKLFKLPAKKTQPKYSFANDEPVSKGQGGNDTGDPTTLSPITSTHVYHQTR